MITLMLSYFKDEEFYTHRSDLRSVKESKELTVKLSVFATRFDPVRRRSGVLR